MIFSDESEGLTEEQLKKRNAILDYTVNILNHYFVGTCTEPIKLFNIDSEFTLILNLSNPQKNLPIDSHIRLTILPNIETNKYLTFEQTNFQSRQESSITIDDGIIEHAVRLTPVEREDFREIQVHKGTFL